MALKQVEVKKCNPILKPAENGFIMEWTEKTKNKGGTYDDWSYGETKSKVYDYDDEENCMKDFKALAKECGFEMEEEDEKEEPEYKEGM